MKMIPAENAGDDTTNTSQSIHLSASAGSGKTRALKERYLALLDLLERRGLNIDQAVAITFTDKAAAEIKERVLHGLPEAMLKKIVRGRQDLRISTIHSFCMNLLKRYPLEAGLPPDFGVLDSRDQAYKIRKSVEDALEEYDRDASIMAPLRQFSADELVAAIEFLLSVRSRLKRLEIDAGGTDRLLGAVYRGMDLEQAEAELQGLIAGTEWRSTLRGMEELLKQSGFSDECLGLEHLRLADAGSIESGRESAAALNFIYFNKDGSPSKKCSIPKTRYRGRDRAGYEKLFFAVQDLLDRFRALDSRLRAGREAVSLLRLFQAAERKYQASKLREGVLDFDDLEIYAYGLLRSLASPDILYWLDRKILHFLVDEFQDTSDIQWAILNKLTEEIFAGQGADKPVAPTLFVVGDEKQSIYRFREANYRLIESLRRRMEQGLPPGSRKILTLDRNYRSTPEVVETVNEVFRRLWSETYKRSEPHRIGHPGSVRLIELLPGSDQASSTTEAHVLAIEIRSLIATGITVREKTGTEWRERTAGYGDCAILIQSRTRLKEYERALQEEGIPYQVVGGIGFYEEDEIQALMNVLFFLWNRDDALALAAALKSPLFGLTDDDIRAVLQGPGGVLDNLERRDAGAARLLTEWTKLAGLVPLAVLIHRILHDTAGCVRFGRTRPQAIFNIDKLLDTAREFDRRGYTSLQDFVEWVKNINRSEQREATADMNLPGFEGAVSIMTVHKAKGLEYPVVFLPGMNQQTRSLSAGPLAVIDDAGGRIRMAVRDAGSEVYREMWDNERGELLREHQRLLYVAMTRARDHLIMIGMLNGGNRPVRENTWLDYLHQAAPQPLFNSETRTGQAVRYTYPAVPPDASVHGARAESGARPRGFDQETDLAALISNLARAPRSDSWEWKKATDFIDHRDEGRPGTIAQTPAAGLSPLTRGTVLHRCLERLARDGSYDLDQIMSEHADLMAMPASARRQCAGDINAVITAVVRDPQLAWVFDRSSDAYSELPFLYRKGRALVSGVIDRLVLKQDTGCVVDYKAIRVQDESDLASWVDQYRPQVQLYCEAVKEMFALRSVEGYLLFLDSNKLALCTSI